MPSKVCANMFLERHAIRKTVQFMMKIEQKYMMQNECDLKITPATECNLSVLKDNFVKIKYFPLCISYNHLVHSDLGPLKV